MTLKIDLDSETQKSLETEADLKGIETEDLAAQLVAKGRSAGEPAAHERLYPNQPTGVACSSL